MKNGPSMQTCLKLILLVALIASAPPVQAGETVAEVLRFEGYLSLNNSLQFALTARNSGVVTRHALLRLRESFCGYTLEDFDSTTEVLTVRNESGKKLLLKPPSSRIGEADPGKIMKAKALQEIEDYRKKTMQRFGGANVVVDLDGSLLPASRKSNYQKHRLGAAEKGMLFFPVSVDGKWHNVFVPIKGKNPDPKLLANLAPEDGDEIRLLWQIAQAEAGGRILAGPPLQERSSSVAGKK